MVLAGVIGLSLTSCVKDIDNSAHAVLGKETVLTFAAESPQGQVVKVVSDAEWHVTAPSWITVDPERGSGTTEVTVIADDNTDEKGLCEPRRDTLIFSGNTLASRYIIIVKQDGDKYRNANHITVTEAAALNDGDSFIIDEAIVAGLTTKGFVFTDGSSFMYNPVAADVKIGDKITIKGLKGSLNGMAVINEAEGISVLSSGNTVTLPEPKDITEGIASYNAEAIEYVKVSGTEVGGNLIVLVGDDSYSVKLVDPIESVKLVAGHKAVVTGFFLGIPAAKTVNLVAADVEDKGPAVVPRPDKFIHVHWRFTTSLLSGYAADFGGTAGLVDLTEGFGGLFVKDNVAEGKSGEGKIEYYQVDKTGTTPTNGNPKRIIGGTGHPYVTGAWPGDYWLFSATDNYEYPAGTNVHIKYLTRISATGQKYWMLEYFDGQDWQPAEEYPVQKTSETNLDPVDYNFIEPTSNVAVESNFKLAHPCRELKFRMRCVANWQSNGSGALANPNGGTCRIADNDDDGEDQGPVFEVLDAPADGGGSGLPSGTPVFTEDFEWLEEASVAAAAGQTVEKNDPNQTAPNIYSTAALAPVQQALADKGYKFINSTSLEGKGADPNVWVPIETKNFNVVYLQRNYLKFGKTSYNAGIILPALAALPSATDVVIEFNWCWMVTGTPKADLMTLQVQADGAGTFETSGAAVSDELTSTQNTTDGEANLAWQKVSLVLKGATAQTVLTIRPTNANPKISNERDQNRWFIDNIVIKTK